LRLHLYDPHSPYRPPESSAGRHADHLDDGEIAFDDAQLGRLFARLQQLKLYDGILIVFASDHGESLGVYGEAEHGFFIYTAVLHVPLISKMPGPASRPPVVTEPAGLVDLAPTITELCGIPRRFTQSFQGHPLAGVSEHEGAQQGPPVFAESYYPRSTFGWHELRTILTPQYRYIDAPQATIYDLRRDWVESHNVAAGQPALAAALREEL